MAKDKKGFVLYADQKELFDQLTNEKAGELIKFIFAYVNDEDPKTEDLIINLAFTPIKQQLKRDLKLYESRAERSRSNGSKGGRPKKAETQETQRVIQEPRKPDTVIVKVTDTVTDKDIVKDIIHRKFDHLTISIVEYDKLCKEWTTEQADEIIDNIENYKNNTNYKSLYLTARKWLKKQHPKQDDALSKIDELKKHY